MVTIKVCPPDKAPLVCTIDTGSGVFSTNIYSSTSCLESEVCTCCDIGGMDTDCKFIKTVSPIAVYFSDIISHENISLYYCNEDGVTWYVDTADNVAFTLFVYSSFYSSCAFFDKFKFLLKYYPPRITTDIYMHMVLTTAIASRQENLKNISTIDVLERIRDHSNELEKRLFKLLRIVRILQNKDAAINAVNMAFVMNDASRFSIERHYHEFSTHIHRLYS